LRSNYSRFIVLVNDLSTELVLKERKEAKRLFLSKLDEHLMVNCVIFWANRVESSRGGFKVNPKLALIGVGSISSLIKLETKGLCLSRRRASLIAAVTTGKST